MSVKVSVSKTIVFGTFIFLNRNLFFIYSYNEDVRRCDGWSRRTIIYIWL